MCRQDSAGQVASIGLSLACKPSELWFRRKGIPLTTTCMNSFITRVNTVEVNQLGEWSEIITGESMKYSVVRMVLGACGLALNACC